MVSLKSSFILLDWCYEMWRFNPVFLFFFKWIVISAVTEISFLLFDSLGSQNSYSFEVNRESCLFICFAFVFSTTDKNTILFLKIYIHFVTALLRYNSHNHIIYLLNMYSSITFSILPGLCISSLQSSLKYLCHPNKKPHTL